jgi:hypothetical protein
VQARPNGNDNRVIIVSVPQAGDQLGGGVGCWMIDGGDGVVGAVVGASL